MKKTIFITGLILLFSGIANAEGFLYGQKAQSIYEEITALKEKLGTLNGECENIAAPMKANFRLYLTDASFSDLFFDYRRNKCLMEDTTYLEKALEEIVSLAPMSKNACETSWQTEIIDEVTKLRNEISCLREYGEKKPEEKVKFNTIECPKESGKFASEYIQNYNDSNCKDKSWSNVFTKLETSWTNLQDKFISTYESTIAMDETLVNNFSLNQDEEDAIQNQAKQNAQNWVKKQSAYISGGSTKIGLTWSGKTPNQLEEFTQSLLDFGKKITDKSFFDKWENIKYKSAWTDRSTILSEFEHLENQENFSQKLIESKILTEINSQLDKELIQGLEGTAKGINEILDNLTNDYDNLSGKNSENNDDNLKTKKEGLKSLLDKQDQ